MSGLKKIYLNGTQIIETKWEGCPINLERIYPKELRDSYQEYKRSKKLRSIKRDDRNNLFI